MKTPLGQLSSTCVGTKLWSEIPENLKSHSGYSFGKQYKKSYALTNMPLDFFHMLVPFFNNFVYNASPLRNIPFTFLIAHPTPLLCIGILFTFSISLLCFVTILSDVMIFVTSFETQSIWDRFVAKLGLTEYVKFKVFCQPFGSQIYISHQLEDFRKSI